MHILGGASVHIKAIGSTQIPRQSKRDMGPISLMYAGENTATTEVCRLVEGQAKDSSNRTVISQTTNFCLHVAESSCPPKAL